jgi:hypothetical protein
MLDLELLASYYLYNSYLFWIHNTQTRFAPVQPAPTPNSIKLNRARPTPYLKPYPKTSILCIGISYFSAYVPYEWYPSHIHTDADHRRRRPSVRSPLPPSNLATTAARQSCECSPGLSRQSDATAAARQYSRLSRTRANRSQRKKMRGGLRRAVSGRVEAARHFFDNGLFIT